MTVKEQAQELYRVFKETKAKGNRADTGTFYPPAVYKNVNNFETTNGSRILVSLITSQTL